MTRTTLHLRDKNKRDVKLIAEIIEPSCEPCDYSMHVQLVNSHGMVEQILLSRRQALELRDWITRIDMYGHD